MAYSLSRTRLVNLIDCPGCKYGTLDRVKDGHAMRCADCGREYPIEELAAKGIVKKAE
jgi:uncharacterized protein YbaR (Trm112 family)